jgi:hypothetical protein
MGFAPDGRLFYYADGRLLSYEPDTGAVRDWGVFTLAGENEPLDPCMGPAAFDDNGRMYFNATISAHEEPVLQDGDEEPIEGEGANDGEPKKPKRIHGLAWINLTGLGQGRLLDVEPD